MAKTGQSGALGIFIRSYDPRNVECGTVVAPGWDPTDCNALMDTIFADVGPPKTWGPRHQPGVDNGLPYVFFSPGEHIVSLVPQSHSNTPARVVVSQPSSFSNHPPISISLSLSLSLSLTTYTHFPSHIAHKCRLSVWGAYGRETVRDTMTYYDMWTAGVMLAGMCARQGKAGKFEFLGALSSHPPLFVPVLGITLLLLLIGKRRESLGVIHTEHSR